MVQADAGGVLLSTMLPVPSASLETARSILDRGQLKRQARS